MKLKSKIMSLLCSLVLMSTIVINANAEDSYDYLKGVGTEIQDVDVPDSIDELSSNVNKIKPSVNNPVRYKKTNVRTYEEWSSGKRVSDNVKAGPNGGSISSTKKVTISGYVEGEVKGITVNFGGSYTSKVGYTLNLRPNRSQYMAYRVRYKVEEGTRVMYDAETGKTIAKNKYKAKKALYGEYYLVG